jgi:hypothetical protein
MICGRDERANASSRLAVTLTNRAWNGRVRAVGVKLGNNVPGRDKPVTILHHNSLPIAQIGKLVCLGKDGYRESVLSE